MAEKVTERRVFSLGRDSYESLAFEATGEGDTLNEARLRATRKVLECALVEIRRVIEARLANQTNDPVQQVILEGQRVEAELAQFGNKPTK